MRITQIMLGKGFGGAERSFVDTALALAARGHKVQAICHRDFQQQGKLENVAGIRLETVRASGEWDFVAPWKIARLIRTFGSRIVHTQLKRAAWHGGRAARRAGVPVVAKLHNYVRLQRYRHVHTLIATTQDQRRHALESGWPAQRIAVIPNFSRVAPVASARMPDHRPLRLITYGRYVRKKGFDVLLQAFARLVRGGVDASLTIGGSGPEQGNLERLAQQLGVAGQVTLGVWIDNVAEALDRSDVFVLPSYDEPFGIVVLEAMARGLPMITTRTRGPSEVLSDDTTAFVETGSVDSLLGALRQVVAEPGAAQARAARALATYRAGYSQDAVLPLLEDLYRDVILQYQGAR